MKYIDFLALCRPLKDLRRGIRVASRSSRVSPHGELPASSALQARQGLFSLVAAHMTSMLAPGRSAPSRARRISVAPSPSGSEIPALGVTDRRLFAAR